MRQLKNVFIISIIISIVFEACFAAIGTSVGVSGEAFAAFCTVSQTANWFAKNSNSENPENGGQYSDQYSGQYSGNDEKEENNESNEHDSNELITIDPIDNLEDDPIEGGQIEGEPDFYLESLESPPDATPDTTPEIYPKIHEDSHGIHFSFGGGSQIKRIEIVLEKLDLDSGDRDFKITFKPPPSSNTNIFSETSGDKAKIYKIYIYVSKLPQEEIQQE